MKAPLPCAACIYFSFLQMLGQMTCNLAPSCKQVCRTRLDDIAQFL